MNGGRGEERDADLQDLYQRILRAMERIQILREKARVRRGELDALREDYALRQYRINQERPLEEPCPSAPLPPDSRSRRRRNLDATSVLLSFPKSGRTWLAYLYLHYAAHRLLGAGAEEYLARQFAHVPLEPLDSLAFGELIRDPAAARLVPRVAFEHSRPHVIYTRFNLAESLGRFHARSAVLLVRNPRDVVVSYYHHLRAGEVGVVAPLAADVDLSECLRSETYGIRAVVTYMNQAATAGPSRFDPFGVLFFEDLHADPAATLARFLTLIGAHAVDPAAIRVATESTTFARLQQQELARRAALGESLDPDALRFRRGRIGSARDELTPSDAAYLDRVIARTLAPAFERYRAPAAAPPVNPATPKIERQEERDARQTEKLERAAAKDAARQEQAAWKAEKRAQRDAAQRLAECIASLGRGASNPSGVTSENARVAAGNLYANLDDVVATRSVLDGLARSGRPIIAGPWVTEPGFELLYWIPFLNWVATQFDLRGDRLIAVSRGGAESWYRHLTTRYHDVFDFYSAEEYRRRMARVVELQGGRKHHMTSDFDHEIIDHVRRAAGEPDAEVLHPSLMIKLFKLYWASYAPMGLVLGHTIARRFARPDLGDLAAQLPACYVAVKFYERESFPDTPENRAFVSACLRHLTTTHHVVVLQTGVRLDQHEEFPLAVRDRIRTIEDLVAPRNNLDVQTRIIAHAEAFVGTYGGFSYLAPLCGVDTLALFSQGSAFRADHLELAKRVFADLKAGSFVPVDVRDLNLLRIALGLDATLSREANTTTVR